MFGEEFSAPPSTQQTETALFEFEEEKKEPQTQEKQKWGRKPKFTGIPANIDEFN